MTEAANPPGLWQYDNPYVAWLICLYNCMARVRTEGLMAIECDVEVPAESKLFCAFPETAQEPYLSFATDVLRMMVGGNLDAEDLGVYAQAAINSQLAANASLGNQTDEALLRTIWLTLWAMAKGNAPQVAIEYGRQAIPFAYKPNFETLEKLARAASSVWRRHPPRDDSLDAQIDSFIASICR